MDIAFRLNSRLYIRDPQDTELGRRIIEQGIQLIDSLGFEHFTFRKLAEAIGSTEASVYRYFENKHRLLLYLNAWYWSWTEYRMEMLTHPSQGPEEKLRWCLRVLTEIKTNDPAFGFVDEVALYRIVLNEQDKTFLTKWVDDDNRNGLFSGYKAICKKMVGLIHEVNPSYRYPNSLVSTVMTASFQQLFYAQHLPSLSSITAAQSDEELFLFLENLTFSAIQSKTT